MKIEYDKNQIVKFVHQGLSRRDIQLRLGISPMLLNKIGAELGLLEKLDVNGKVTAKQGRVRFWVTEHKHRFGG